MTDFPHQSLQTILLVVFSLFSAVLSPVHVAGATIFKHYSVEQGLPQNTVWCSLQDAGGFMWFGTKDGLARFDGRSFKVFRHEEGNEQSIGNNFIRSLLEVKPGELWVGTDCGVYRLETATGRFSRLSLGDERWTASAVNSMAVDKDERVWLGCFNTGLAIVDKEGALQKRYENNGKKGSLQSNRVWRVFCDHEGTIWVGTLNSGLHRYNRKNDSFTTFGPEHGQLDGDVYEIYEDANNNLWIGYWSEGLVQFNPHNNTFLKRGNVRVVRGISEVAPHKLLVACEGYLAEYDVKTGAMRLIQHFETSTVRLHDAIYSVIRDREGGVWIGGYFQGLFYYHEQNSRFAHYEQLLLAPQQGSSVFSAMTEDNEKKLWLATEDTGLWRYAPQSDRLENMNERIGLHTARNLHALLSDGDRIWIGTFGEGVYIYNKVSGALEHHNHATGLANHDVFALGKDSSGRVYAGTIFGLWQYEAGHFSMVEEVGADTYVYDICQDRRGRLWLATYNRGVFCREKGRWRNYRHIAGDSTSVSHDKVIALHCDRKGTLWFGTEGGGLCRYDDASDSFVAFPQVKGVVYGIEDDEEGRLWLSGNSGLACFSPATGELVGYSQGDGLQSNQFNYKSFAQTDDGLLLFGGINGVNSFYPQEIKHNQYLPPVHVAAQSTMVPYGEPLSLEFASLSYVSPMKNQFMYRIKGLGDERWTSLGTDSWASFRQLPPGKYVFEVKATNNDGVWSDSIATIAITIRPPFWLSLPAKILYSLLIVALIVAAVVHLQRRQKRRMQQEIDAIEQQKEQQLREKEAEQERAILNNKIAFFTNIADGNDDDNFIQRVREIFGRHLADSEFSIDNLAEEMGMSRSSLQRRFNALFDMTPNAFLRVYRLKYAMTLLTEGSHRISDVCYMVGFSSTSYFSKCFQQQFGMAPKEVMGNKE